MLLLLPSEMVDRFGVEVILVTHES
uniref:Uncharacterized protein n=1 Tax=Anguilla anguilla TaxID=7936 RepID=A0A0E9UU26_ANGAN